MFGRKRKCVWKAGAESERHHPAAESRRWQKNNTSWSRPVTEPAFNATTQNLLIIALSIITLLTFPIPTLIPPPSLHHYFPSYKFHLLLLPHFILTVSTAPCFLTTLSTLTLHLFISNPTNNNSSYCIFLAPSVTTFLPPPSPFTLPFTRHSPTPLLNAPKPTPVGVKCALPPETGAATASFTNGGLGEGRFGKTVRSLCRFLTPLKKPSPLL